MEDYSVLRKKHEKVLMSDLEVPPMELSGYLQCFQYTLTNSSDFGTDEQNEKNFMEQINNNNECIYLNRNITLKNKKALGSFYFSKLLKPNVKYDYQEFKNLIEPIPLKIIELLVSNLKNQSFKSDIVYKFAVY